MDLDPRSGGVSQQDSNTNASAAATAAASILQQGVPNNIVGGYGAGDTAESNIEHTSFIEQVERDTSRNYTLDRASVERFTSPLQDRLHVAQHTDDDDPASIDSDAELSDES